MGIVSIIMPVYNVEKHLKKAIESAVNQTYSNWELILVNDGSTDLSGEICDDYQKKDSRIRVIHQENKGSGPARNTGLKKAKGTYIYFADPDDYFEPTLLAENLSLITSNKSDVIVFGFFEEKRKGNERVEEKVPNFNSTKSIEKFRENFESYFSFHPYALWNKLYRRSYLEDHHCRFTNQKLGQDALFNLEVLGYLGAVSVNPKPYYHYVQHEGSAVNRYRKNRFELEYTISSRFEEVMQKWGKAEQYQYLIMKEYWNAVYLELVNLSSPRCPLDKNKKLQRLEDIQLLYPVQQAFQNYPVQYENNLFTKKLIQALKNGKTRRALNLMEFRLLVESKFYPFFSWAKETFQ